MKKINKFLLNNKIIYLITIVGIIVLFAIPVYCGVIKYKLGNVINTVHTICDIVLIIVSVTGIIFTLIYAFRQYEFEKKHRRISKAADLAKLYADELLKPISLIIIEFNQIEDSVGPISNDFRKMLDKVDLDEIHEFNENELNKIFNDKEILAYKFILYKKIMIEENETVTLSKIINSTLNKIEYFCIYFNSNVAEDMTVYQSLHQTFFKLMKYVYVFICITNTSELDKYFTNIIMTHIRWRKIYNKNKIEYDKNKLKIEKKQNKIRKVEEKCKEQLSKKTNVPKV